MDAPGRVSIEQLRAQAAGLGIFAARGGRPEKHPRREIVDVIRYVVDTGCK
jgi:hypothetical protein